MKESVQQNLTDLRGRIAAACEAHGRDMDDVTIVAVTKAFPASTIRIAVACGLHDVGESRVQEAEGKIREVGQIARLHLVGHLQSNKVKKAVELFDVIQSVDSAKLAAEINQRAAEAGRKIECLLQVNISGEEQKFGLRPSDLLEIVEHVLPLPNIELAGLMGIGPNTDNESDIRAAYAGCRSLFESARAVAGPQFDTLSIGMTDDFALAIAEGSTMIRVGTGIFGRRPPRSH